MTSFTVKDRDINRFDYLRGLYQRRQTLVMKGNLDAEDQAELDGIDASLDALPAGDTAEQRHAWES